jgi:hypothetical protein
LGQRSASVLKLWERNRGHFLAFKPLCLGTY